jgi:glycosyltransferase involved in cell wall biosynthesis
VTTVLFDVRRATWRPHTGLSRYTRGMVQGIRDLDPPDMRVVPLDVEESAHWPDMDPVAVGRGHSFARRFAQEQVGMARASRRADLMHLPWHEGPFVSLCPLVVTIHDVDSVERPAGNRWRFRAYYNSLLRTYVRTARRILVPSQTSLDALERRWPGRPYVLVHNGIDPVFTPPAEDSERERSILYTGGFGLRKRLPDLLAAFDAVAQRDGDVRLTITGEPDGDAKAAVRSARASARIDLLDRIGEEPLAELYRRAAVVVYPCEGEGFGFPVVEGFASGTPVVACESGSVPEVAGDAALLVPPRQPSELADALVAVLTDSGQASRLRASGLERAREFTWERAARLTLDAYREALQ